MVAVLQKTIVRESKEGQKIENQVEELLEQEIPKRFLAKYLLQLEKA